MKESMAEALKAVQGIMPSTYPAAATLLNGFTAGAGIDTRDYDEALIELHLGSLTSPDTLTVSVNEYATDVAASSTAITSATFAAKNEASSTGIFVARLRLERYDRYIWIKTVTTGTNEKFFSASCILGKKDSGPDTQTNTLEFDV